MELPTRSAADRFTTPGRYRELETQIRRRVQESDIPILFIYAFDPRTRLGPFVFVDKTLIPAPRGLWAPRIRRGLPQRSLGVAAVESPYPAQRARFAGKPPEVLMISAMQIHSAGVPADPRRLAIG